MYPKLAECLEYFREVTFATDLLCVFRDVKLQVGENPSKLVYALSSYLEIWMLS